jgi:hypothetical protein
MWDSIENFIHAVASHPAISIAGMILGILFPVPAQAILTLVLLSGIDVLTGRSAAYSRGELVTSGKTRKMSISKLQGYLIFITAAGLASNVAGDVIMLKGALGLLSAVELFSITENLYDMNLIGFNPREVSLFKGIVNAIKKRK